MSQPSTEMKNDAQIVLRVPQELSDRLKSYTGKLSRDAGVPITVAMATRKLLELALAAEGFAAAAEASTKTKRSSKR